MEILFVIDSLNNLDNKINLLKAFDADIKFFVDAKLAPQLVKNKYIINHIIAIYNRNVNITIDKYIKQSTYTPTATLLYYASANLDTKLINNIRENLKLKPDVIYVKKRLSLWDKFKLWFYDKLIRLIFGVKDEYASTKIQYFSDEMMGEFSKSSFKNHIFSFRNAQTIELEKSESESYYARPGFNKNYLYNPIALCLILICYVVLERFFKLPFVVYFFVIALIISVLFVTVVMIINNTFNKRYKK